MVRTLAIGFFDGVHLGHQAILRGASSALTFRNHPLSVLAPERAPRLIMTPEERLAAIRACGVEDVRLLDFTPALAALTAADFLRDYIQGGARGGVAVRCGENWRFGKDGAGDAELLRRTGVPVEVVSYADYAGEPISSSRIRRCLEDGAVGDANAMMGRRFASEGVLFKGKGMGAGLGFPTLNLRLPSLAVRLPLGVYEVEMQGCRAVANYGRAPTMGARAWNAPVLEAHLLHPSSAALAARPDDRMSVEFVRFIRPERTFASLDDLKRQIAADCDKIAP